MYPPSRLNLDDHNRVSTTIPPLAAHGEDYYFRVTAPTTLSMWPSVQRGEHNYIFPFQNSAIEAFNSAWIMSWACWVLPTRFWILSNRRCQNMQRRCGSRRSCIILSPSLPSMCPGTPSCGSLSGIRTFRIKNTRPCIQPLPRCWPGRNVRGRLPSTRVPPSRTRVS